MLFISALPEYFPEERSATTPLRAHWMHLTKALQQAEGILTSLSKLQTDQQGTELYVLDLFLMDGLISHLQAEERTLFPIADELEPTELPISTVLREESRHIRELVIDFHRHLLKPAPDIGLIQLKGIEIIRHAVAHIREGEGLLFPYIDAHMSEKEVMERLAGPMLDHEYDIGPVDHHASSHHMARFHRPPG